MRAVFTSQINNHRRHNAVNIRLRTANWLLFRDQPEAHKGVLSDIVLVNRSNILKTTALHHSTRVLIVRGHLSLGATTSTLKHIRYAHLLPPRNFYATTHP